MNTIIARTNNLWMPSASFTRPADTTAYGAGDAMGSGAAACRLSFPVPIRHGLIKSARLFKSSTGTTNDDFRLLLWRATPTANPDENAAPTTSFVNIADARTFLGSIDFETIDHTLAGGITYAGQDYVPSTGIPFHIQNNVDPVIFGILTAITAYAPGNAEVFTITLQIDQ